MEAKCDINKSKKETIATVLHFLIEKFSVFRVFHFIQVFICVFSSEVLPYFSELT